MFIGIDHGTTAMRFSTGTEEFKISREEARDFSAGDQEDPATGEHISFQGSLLSEHPR